MSQNTILDEQKKILAVFSEYLANQPERDFVISKKFGLLCVSLWSTSDDAVYDIVHVASVEHLLEVLADIIVSDHMAQRIQLCITAEETQLMMAEYLEPYFIQLPE